MAINPSVVDDDDTDETYQLPNSDSITDPYLKEVWDQVVEELEGEESTDPDSDDDDEETEDDEEEEPSSQHSEESKSLSNLLTSHGWFTHSKKPNRGHYHHANLKGRIELNNVFGKWSHHDRDGVINSDNRSESKPHKSLKEHLVNLDSSQHSESDEILEKFLAAGTASKIQSAKERINALKTSSISLPELAEHITQEIFKLQPLLSEHLVASDTKHHTEGLAEVVKSLPKEYLELHQGDSPTVDRPPSKDVEEETKAPSEPSLEGDSPVKPPTDTAIASSGEGSPTVAYPALDDAIGVLGASKAKVGIDYRETAELVREGAFAVTGELTENAVETIKNTLQEALADGHSQTRFIDNVLEKLEKGNEGILSEPHLETVFRTNALSAKSNAKLRALNNPIVSSIFPYVSYSATRDARVRPEHKQLESLGLQGTNFYRADDPVFAEFRPPWSYNCRCNFVGRTVEQAARAGVTEAVNWKLRAENLAKLNGGSFYQYILEVAPTTGEYVAHPPFSAPPEFKRELA